MRISERTRTMPGAAKKRGFVARVRLGLDGSWGIEVRIPELRIVGLRVSFRFRL